MIDERNLTAALPYFTAGNLKRIPFVNADSVSVITMAKKLEILEQRMISVEQLLLTPTLQSIGSIDHESPTPAECHKDNCATDEIEQLSSNAIASGSTINGTDTVSNSRQWTSFI